MRLKNGPVNVGFLGAASCLLLLVGCHADSAYPVVRVAGVVKYDDGSLIPAHRIAVKFISQSPPVDLKTHPRPGLGEVNIEDGTITVSTYGFDDGLIRGKHKVTVQSLDERNRLTSAIPQLYRLPQSSPLEIDTDSGPFELLIKKP